MAGNFCILFKKNPKLRQGSAWLMPAFFFEVALHMKNFLVISIFLAFPFLLEAQYLEGISTRYNDSFIEWLFYIENKDEPGELKIRWQSREDDWTEWDYRIGEIFGRIEMKWKDKPDEWELRGNNEIVTARTIWNGDFREWRISDGDRSLTLKTKWGNLWDEWELRDTRHGNFYMYTSWERDPRDWVVVDEMNDDVPFETKMMLMFIVIFNSSPKQ